MKALPNRKGNHLSYQLVGGFAVASMKAPPKRKGNFHGNNPAAIL